MKKQFDVLVFIGRFSPFHIGHLQVLATAAQKADKVIVLVGSSNQPRTIKNPFTFDDRRKMIIAAYEEAGLKAEYGADIDVLPLRDFKADNNIWAVNVQKIVDNEVAKLGWSDKPRRVGLIGHAKDSSSFYLNLFPQWETIDHTMNELVNATDIRALYFESNIRYIKDVVPASIYAYLEKFKTTGEYTTLLEEYNFIKAYKKAWEAAPYAPTFLTADAVVVQSGHILLIKRKAAPGKGLWALPGGFVEQNERIEDAMIRELREETKIKVPAPVLRGSIKNQKVFDAPDRSLRGRTVTQAFFIELADGELPDVRGGDDAVEGKKGAKWVPLSFVREEELFEDHYSIIQSFIGQF